MTQPAEPTPNQRRVLRLIPDTDGLTVKQVIAAAKADGMTTGHNGLDPTIGGIPAKTVLRVMRRHGWLIHNRHVDPPRYVRTPTGTTLTTQRRPASMTTTPRQEATHR